MHIIKDTKQCSFILFFIDIIMAILKNWEEPVNIYLWTPEVQKIYKWYTIEEEKVQLQEFTYTWSDQHFTVPTTGRYFFSVKWAGSNNAAWGLAEGTVELTEWDELSIMVWQTGNAVSSGSTTYWFGWSGNAGSGRAWGWLSGVFTWSSAITASDSSRALIIWGWAGAGNSKGNGWMWGWETWQAWQGWSYGTAWAWGTQTWHGSWGNVWANQFNGWNGSWTYWQGWGGWWRWGNASAWDSSWDDDRNGWGGSGYVISTATDRKLEQGTWATATNNGSVVVYQYVPVRRGIQVRPWGG